METTRIMYPDIEPYETGMLKVSDIHTVYYEQSGNPTGNPVIYLHGGPGSGTSPRSRTFFDQSVYRIVLLDQRGAGKSTPAGELKENTTWDLVSDLETLREHLGIERWVVFGGSWGSTLALAYAETHPTRVKALILRGIFLATRREVLWANQEGVNFMYPDEFEKYQKIIPEGERNDMVSAYHRRLCSNDVTVQLEAARAWIRLANMMSSLLADPEALSELADDSLVLQCAKIEVHYSVHGGFFNEDDWLFKHVVKIRHIPTTIIHGRYDMVCPVEAAWKLHKAFPEADLQIVADAGHSSSEPGIQSRLLDACDKYKLL